MTDKKKANPETAKVNLSAYGILRIIKSLQTVAQECIQHYRAKPGDGSDLSNFREALSDLNAALTALDRLMDMQGDFLRCNSNFSFHEIGQIMAFAEAAGIKIPAGVREILAGQDLYFPLEFLAGVETLRFAHPSIQFELRQSSAPSDMDDEIPF